MKLFICSDLHIDYLTPDEYASFVFPVADAYLIAGDHMDGVVAEHYEWLLNKTNGIPTYICPGNHDYFGSSRVEAVHKMRALTQGTHIQVVFNEAVELAPGLQLWASDFWTDLELTGNKAGAVEVSKTQWDDFDRIEVIENGSSRMMNTDDMVRWHRQSLSQFVDFSRQTEDDVILMSHHGLVPEVLVNEHQQVQIGEVAALFASDASEVLLKLKAPPFLLVSGHVHQYVSLDLTPDMSLYCNPRGPDGKLNHTLVEVSRVQEHYQVLS